MVASMDGEQADGSPRLRVMIVDDDAADRLNCRRLLREHASEWDVVEAGTGAEALDRLMREPVDCVLLDYHLPDMDGSGFMRRLNGGDDADLPPVPVAVLTGRHDQRIAQRMLHEGAQDYMVKGTLTSAGLVRVIENAIEKHAIRWELERKRAAVEMRTWQLERTQEQLRAKVAELAAATRAKDQFVAVMSHEMRTPLNAILGYAELLEVGVQGDLPPAAREYVERIRLGGRHLLDLINDVLDLSRVEAEDVDLLIRAVDPVAVCEEITHLLEREAVGKGIRLALEPPERPVPAIAGDLRRVRQIMTNLVANAIKFTDQGEVTLSLESRGATVALIVRDTGVGIPREALPHIFERFFQVDGSFTRRRGGIGLGLAIAQRLARQMGGDLLAESEEGKGSTFTLVLPVALDDGPAAAAALPSVVERLPAVPADPAVRVLAYSDNENALAALQTHVAPSIELRWTTCADEVLALAIEGDVDLIVLDISAADGAAWGAAQSLQDVPELTSTAVLLLPMIPEPAGREPSSAIDLGWISLVPKPFTEQQLTTAVSRAADSRGRRHLPRTADDPPAEVLVVDDDPESRHVARTFLARAGLRVREATDGESALVAMRFRRPDVVVLDLMMPVIDGFGVLAAMRADARLVDVPVVVLSAKSLTAAEQAFLGRSAVRVLQKGEHRLSDVAALVMRAAAGRNG